MGKFSFVVGAGLGYVLGHPGGPRPVRADQEGDLRRLVQPARAAAGPEGGDQGRRHRADAERGDDRQDRRPGEGPDPRGPVTRRGPHRHPDRRRLRQRRRQPARRPRPPSRSRPSPDRPRSPRDVSSARDVTVLCRAHIFGRRGSTSTCSRRVHPLPTWRTPPRFSLLTREAADPARAPEGPMSRSRSTRRRLAAAGGAAALALTLAGCGGGGGGGGGGSAGGSSGTLPGAGASSQEKAMNGWLAGSRSSTRA